MATRAQLRQSARVAADQDNSDFPDDVAYNDFIDRAAGRVYRRLMAAGWKPSQTLVTITATGASSYSLGTAVQSVQSVLRNEGTSFRLPLHRLKPEELPNALSLAGPAIAYELTGGTTSATAITLYPNPSSGTYEVRYIPQFAGFTSDSDPWYGPDGSDELVALEAAMLGLAKEDGDTSEIRRTLYGPDGHSGLWAEVLDSAQWQDGQGQQVIRDNRNANWGQHRNPAFDWQAGEGWY